MADDLQLNVVAAKQLAEAFHHIARVNHYMVGIVYRFTEDELNAAEQLLITQQNMGPQRGKGYQVLERALDLLDAERCELRKRTIRRGDTTGSPADSLTAPKERSLLWPQETDDRSQEILAKIRIHADQGRAVWLYAIARWTEVEMEACGGDPVKWLIAKAEGPPLQS